MDENNLDKNSGKTRIQSVIEFVTGALLTYVDVDCTQNEPDLIEECKRDIIPMREYARIQNQIQAENRFWSYLLQFYASLYWKNIIKLWYIYEEDFNAIEVQNGIQLFNSLK